MVDLSEIDGNKLLINLDRHQPSAPMCMPGKLSACDASQVPRRRLVLLRSTGMIGNQEQKTTTRRRILRNFQVIGTKQEIE